MATNFTVSSLTTFPNPEPNKVLRQLILDGEPTMNHYSYVDEVKDYKTIHRVSASAIDVSTGALLGFPSLTAGGGTTLVPVTLQVTPLKITPEFYTAAQLDQTTAAVFNKKGTDPEANAPDLLFNVVKELKGQQLKLFVEKFYWQADTSTTQQTAGTTLNSRNGIIAQIRGVAGGYGNPSVDLTSLSDASIRDHVKILYNAAVKGNEALASQTVNISMAPVQYQALYAATFGLNGLINGDTLRTGKGGADAEIVSSFKLPYAENAYVYREMGLTGKTQIILTTPENIVIGMDDTAEQNFVDLWYNKVVKGWQLDAALKAGMIVADPSLCFTTT